MTTAPNNNVKQNPLVVVSAKDLPYGFGIDVGDIAIVVDEVSPAYMFHVFTPERGWLAIYDEIKQLKFELEQNKAEVDRLRGALRHISGAPTANICCVYAMNDGQIDVHYSKVAKKSLDESLERLP